MELLLTVGYCFVILLVCLIITAVLFRYINYFFFRRKEARLAPWQDLATDIGLTYVPGRFPVLRLPELPYFIGPYRKHSLRLEVVERKRDGGVDIFTRISVSVNTELHNNAMLEKYPLNQPIPPETIGRLLSAVDLSPLQGETYVLADGHVIRYQKLGAVELWPIAHYLRIQSGFYNIHLGQSLQHNSSFWW